MSLESMISQIGKAGKEMSEGLNTFKDTGQKWDGDLPGTKAKAGDGWDGGLPKEQKQNADWDGTLSESMKESQQNGIKEVERFQEGIDKNSETGRIYQEAGVNLDRPENTQLLEKEYQVYKTDIDPHLEGPDGRTNLSRMKDGNAAYVDRDGKLTRVELHHHDQKDQGNLVELDRDTHNKNDGVLHPNQGKGEGRGNDPQWDARRQDYWKQRMQEFDI